MWAQRVIDEAASGSTRNAELNAARDSSKSGKKPADDLLVDTRVFSVQKV